MDVRGSLWRVPRLLGDRKSNRSQPKADRSARRCSTPRSVREVQRLTGKIAALNRFISISTDRYLPFYKLLKGNKKFEWNIECDSALKELKTYISEPPVLSKPIIGETLFLYVATSEHAVSGVLIREENGEY